LIRKLQFTWFYEPKLKKFLQDSTPYLMAMYKPLPDEPDISRAH
jgi:hypothetical protein